MPLKNTCTDYKITKVKNLLSILLYLIAEHIFDLFCVSTMTKCLKFGLLYGFAANKILNYN